MNEVLGDCEVVLDEFGWVGVIRVNATHLGGGYDNDVRGFIVEELGCFWGVAEVEFFAGAGDDVVKTFFCKCVKEGRADHAVMACDVDFIGSEHGGDSGYDCLL